MRTYKLFIQEYNIMENDYITREEIVKTNDIYHEIGKIYCQSLVKIKRIDYLEITKDLEQEIEKLHFIIKEVREKINTIQFAIKSNDKRYSNLYIKLKDTQQGQELLEILDKESE